MRLPRADREAQLVDIALSHFAREGYHAVSVDQVAAEAGVTKPLVYAYFGSKEGLFVASAERAAERLIAALQASAELHTDPELRMWFGCLEVFKFIEEHREAWAVLYLPESPGGPFGGPAVRASEAIAELITAQFIDTAERQGIVPAASRHLEPLAHGFVHATIGLGRWWLDHPELSREMLAMHLMNLAWVGLRNLSIGAWWIPPPPGQMQQAEERT